MGKVDKKELCEKAHIHHVSRQNPDLAIMQFESQLQKVTFQVGSKIADQILKKGIGDPSSISALKSIHFLSAVLIISILL